MTVAALPGAAVERLIADGAIVVDVRQREEFAAGHLPGSINLESGEGLPQFGAWVLPQDSTIVLVGPEPASASAAATTEAAALLARTGGQRRVVGRLLGGVPAWQASGRPIRRYPLARMRDLLDASAGRDPTERPLVLDVRAPAEWGEDGLLPGATNVWLADLPLRVDDLARDREWWVVCATGARAAVAASILDAADVPVRLVGRGGVIGWVERFAEAS